MKLTYLPNAPVYKGIPGAILAKKDENFWLKLKIPTYQLMNSLASSRSVLEIVSNENLHHRRSRC